MTTGCLTRLPLRAAFVLAAWLGVSAFLPAQTAKPAAGPLAPFGVSEATVRALLLESVSRGGEISNRLVVMIQDGYERIPVAMREAATTAAFAWPKRYVSSPVFATAYAQYRYTGVTFAVLASGTIMTLGRVPYWARLSGDRTVVPFPIPLVIKNRKNPM